MNIIIYAILTIISTIGTLLFTFTGIASTLFGFVNHSDPNAMIIGFSIAIISLVLQQICIKLDPSNKYEEDW